MNTKSSIKRKINKIRKGNNWGCLVIIAAIFVALIAVVVLVSKFAYNVISSLGLSMPVTICLIVLMWLLLFVALYYSFKDKKMSKKELRSCLRSMNCTLPDFEIIKQTSNYTMGWGPNGSNNLQRTIEIKFKRKDASKTLDKNISLYKSLEASAPASLSIEIKVNHSSNTAIIKYIESRDN